ncbi:MAG: retroviral-like aspartic protease family protein [Nanoarchaeota archaeon]|nr:retroviral-like aspartic protease family protein [Nanoarchaeota archaeon]MBU1269528.1 retroviral-like aspartic protease family protein [Nanoarchaeota archaeon]MBU1604769.1 retroviral-like aspartic protease family protein [Nanoarchaeota archaeon]MBU2442909.1 retroviral-like aspartic protease family protein [Nanoarchaeota archaeon]
MTIIFRYVHIPRPDKTLRKAPFIPIYVKNKFGKLMQVIALLDSGVDVTVVPKELAELIGLKEDSYYGHTAGIGGEVKVRNSTIKFTVKNEHEHHTLSIPALVLQDVDSDVPLLLGRNGFFENFHVTFRQNEEKIILKKIDFVKKY